MFKDGGRTGGCIAGDHFGGSGEIPANRFIGDLMGTVIVPFHKLETDEDFEDTLALARRVGFAQAFSFKYSARPGTPAASLPDDTPLDVKKQRLQLLQARINQQAQAISEAMVGTTQRVLVEKVSRKSTRQVTGRTENNRWVNFDAEPSVIGQFLDVVITEALPNSLRGRRTDSKAAA